MHSTPPHPQLWVRKPPEELYKKFNIDTPMMSSHSTPLPAPQRLLPPPPHTASSPPLYSPWPPPPQARPPHRDTALQKICKLWGCVYVVLYFECIRRIYMCIAVCIFIVLYIFCLICIWIIIDYCLCKGKNSVAIWFYSSFFLRLITG